MKNLSIGVVVFGCLLCCVRYGPDVIGGRNTCAGRMFHNLIEKKFTKFTKYKDFIEGVDFKLGHVRDPDKDLQVPSQLDYQPLAYELGLNFITTGPASSILCYDCNSEFDPRCGEHFDPFSLGIINCSLRDPPEHLDVGEPTFCRSIKMQIEGKVRIVRQCGYLADEDGSPPCRRVVGNGDLFVTYCTCNTDLCNSAMTHHHQMALIVSFISIIKYFI